MLQRKCRLGEMTMPGIILFTMIRTLSSKVDRTIAALTDAAENLMHAVSRGWESPLAGCKEAANIFATIPRKNPFCLRERAEPAPHRAGTQRSSRKWTTAGQRTMQLRAVSLNKKMQGSAERLNTNTHTTLF